MSDTDNGDGAKIPEWNYGTKIPGAKQRFDCNNCRGPEKILPTEVRFFSGRRVFDVIRRKFPVSRV
jgi:hypothetical protein